MNRRKRKLKKVVKSIFVELFNSAFKTVDQFSNMMSAAKKMSEDVRQYYDQKK